MLLLMHMFVYHIVYEKLIVIELPMEKNFHHDGHPTNCILLFFEKISSLCEHVSFSIFQFFVIFMSLRRCVASSYALFFPKYHLH